MITINEAFKQFCLDTFGEFDGKKVHTFYKKFFDTRYRHLGYNVNYNGENKKKQINLLLEKVSKQRLLDVIEKFTEEWKAGKEKTHAINYFEAVVLNKNSYNFPTQQKEIIISKPLPFKRVRDEYESKYEAFNWNYQCECKHEITPWDKKCPNCNAEIDFTDAGIAIKEMRKND